MQVGQDQKFDKGDQHDSGIDVSDHPNSGGSSTRSSPSTENKIAVPKLEKVHILFKFIQDRTYFVLTLDKIQECIIVRYYT